MMVCILHVSGSRATDSQVTQRKILGCQGSTATQEGDRREEERATLERTSPGDEKGYLRSQTPGNPEDLGPVTGSCMETKSSRH